MEIERNRLQTLTEVEQNESRLRQRRLEELTSNVESIKLELIQAREQHEEYKAKAKKVLFEKEKLITSLRDKREGGEVEEMATAELQQAM